MVKNNLPPRYTGPEPRLYWLWSFIYHHMALCTYSLLALGSGLIIAAVLGYISPIVFIVSASVVVVGLVLTLAGLIIYVEDSVSRGAKEWGKRTRKG